MRRKTIVACAGIILTVLIGVGGCQTLRQVAALRMVDFALDNVADVRLAGVQLDRIRSYEDLRPTDLARLAASLAQRRLPLAFDLHVAAGNPADNPVEARLLSMDWTLFLEDRETISGVLDQEFLIPPGSVTDIPLRIQLDLVDFFGDNMRDLVNLALSLSGEGGEPTNVRLEALPTINTAIGPIRYPQPITIISREIR